MGLDLYDAENVKELGYKAYKNVITTLEFERIVDPDGPTGGKVLRPSDEKVPRSIAFVLCVGSRDQKYQSSCCGIGCMTALKQAYELKQAYGDDMEVFLCYNDMRAAGRMHEEFYQSVRETGVVFLHGLPSEIWEIEGDRLTFKVFDLATSKLQRATVDMVVLVSGFTLPMAAEETREILNLPLGSDGFLLADEAFWESNRTQVEGVFLAGCSAGPMSIDRVIAHA